MRLHLRGRRSHSRAAVRRLLARSPGCQPPPGSGIRVYYWPNFLLSSLTHPSVLLCKKFCGRRNSTITRCAKNKKNLVYPTSTPQKKSLSPPQYISQPTAVRIQCNTHERGRDRWVSEFSVLANASQARSRYLPGVILIVCETEGGRGDEGKVGCRL